MGTVSRVWVVLGILVPMAGCGGKELAPLERFPLAPRVVCEDTTTDAKTGEARTTTTVEACTREGDRVRCSQSTTEGGETTTGWGEERVDAAGHWAVGNDLYALEPPVLSFPADIAPGKAWVVETTWVMRDGGERIPVVKTHNVSSSERCEGGLLIETVREGKAPGSTRVENALHVCPGMSSPREYTSRTINDQGLVRTTVGRCRAEPAGEPGQK